MTDAVQDERPVEDVRAALLTAALAHVPFDGWSEVTFRRAAADAQVALPLARAVCPRGSVDLAVAFHRRGDAAMVARLRVADLAAMRFRDRIAAAVRFRLESVTDKEAARRASALFALPQHAGTGARLIWDTVDMIWTTLGDTADDINWYTKRGTLSAVYAATALYWLGDTSPENTATWEFLDRRIGNVMQIEDLKAAINKNPVLKTLMAGPNWLLGKVRKPARMPDMPMPGGWPGAQG